MLDGLRVREIGNWLKFKVQVWELVQRSWTGSIKIRSWFGLSFIIKMMSSPKTSSWKSLACIHPYVIHNGMRTATSSWKLRELAYLYCASSGSEIRLRPARQPCGVLVLRLGGWPSGRMLGIMLEGTLLARGRWALGTHTAFECMRALISVMIMICCSCVHECMAPFSSPWKL